MKAIGYVRKSLEEKGLSLASQENKIRSFAQAHGWKLYKIYEDAVSPASRRKGLPWIK